MAPFQLRLRGSFIDVAAPTMTEQRKRSDSAPPCRGPRCSDQDLPEHALDQARQRYVSSLFERAAQLPYHTQGMPSTLDPSVGGEARTRVKPSGVFNSPPSDSTDAPDMASTADSQSQFEGDLAVPNHVVSKPITTLMLSGFSYRLRSQELVDVINQQGFTDAYDLCFLPVRPHSRRASQYNLGFAFVNFKTPEYATAFARAFNNVAFPDGRSTKLCSTRPAREQGFEANLKDRPSLRSSGSFRIIQ